MINNFDIVKNGLFDLFLNTVCNGNNITIETIETELTEINKMDLYESKEIIENSKFINLISKICNKYELSINFNVSDLDLIKEIYLTFETEFYKLYGFEPL